MGSKVYKGLKVSTEPSIQPENQIEKSQVARLRYIIYGIDSAYKYKNYNTTMIFELKVPTELLQSRLHFVNKKMDQSHTDYDDESDIDYITLDNVISGFDLSRRQTEALRANWHKACDKKNARICTKSCKQTYKDTCRLYDCPKKMRFMIAKQCRLRCFKTFDVKIKKDSSSSDSDSESSDSSHEKDYDNKSENEGESKEREKDKTTESTVTTTTKKEDKTEITTQKNFDSTKIDGETTKIEETTKIDETTTKKEEITEATITKNDETTKTEAETTKVGEETTKTNGNTTKPEEATTKKDEETEITTQKNDETTKAGEETTKTDEETTATGGETSPPA